MSKILRIDICGECKNSSWTGPRSGCCWKLSVKLTEYCAIHPDCPLEDVPDLKKIISADGLRIVDWLEDAPEGGTSDET